MNFIYITKFEIVVCDDPKANKNLDRTEYTHTKFDTQYGPE